MRLITTGLVAAVAFAMPSMLMATDVARPTLKSYSNNTIILNLSENGKWAIAENRNEDDKTGNKLVEVATMTWSAIPSTGTNISATAVDVTNDGKIIVGSADGYPAWYDSSVGKWQKVSMPSGYISGTLQRVTPDGKYAVGIMGVAESIYQESPGLWDLTTGKYIETPNVPQLDITGSNEKQNRFTSISSDGRYILGMMSVSYIMPWQVTCYVYDRETATYDIIGFTRQSNGKCTAVDSDLFGIDDVSMSHNGKYVTGTAKILNSSTEFDSGFLYNVETKQLDLYKTPLDEKIRGVVVDNSGRVFAAYEESGDPLRDGYVREGKYWYALSDIYSQRYGINFETYTGFTNTGTPMAVSGDGMVLAPMVNPNGYGYLLKMAESFDVACADIDLMGNYYATPLAGSQFSNIAAVTLTFDRAIKVLGAANAAQILDPDGKVVRSSMSITADGTKATIMFRKTTLEANKIYTVHIPAEMFCMSVDEEVKSRAIDVKYVGRADVPLAPGTIYPSAGSAVSKFDASTSHIMLYFDTNVTVSETASAGLYRGEELVATLSMVAQANVLTLYPTSTNYLYDGDEYTVVVAAGSVTDAGGNGGNQQITINYKGSYVRSTNSDDKILYSEDFNEGLGSDLLFYEGDHGVPTEEMQGYGFTQDTTPWWIARDSDAYDYAAMSHSRYNPAKQSDDWMVIPHLYIPDENCYMTFDSQSFKFAAKDYLKVYVIPMETGYNSLNEEVIALMKEKRELVFNERQKPGKSEDNLEGDWVSNYIDLKAYAGKYVYIAFVNEDAGASAIFVDNIVVTHDMRYLAALDNEDVVTQKDQIDIYGHVEITTDNTYNNANIRLYDADGVLIDEVAAENLNLNKGDMYKFRFSKPLALKQGKINNYSVTVSLDDETYTFKRTVTNLLFPTTKRVTIEEYAGSDCGNCPQGIVVFDKLKETYGDNAVCISIRTYNSDPLSYGLESYSQFLGFTGAPQACIQRKTLAFAAVVRDGMYYMNANENESPLWLDLVAEEMSEPALLNFDITATYDTSLNAISVPMTMNYAVDVTNLNISTFAVVLEDDIETYQCNYYAKSTDPFFGAWGANGEIGKNQTGDYAYPVIADDVVRGVAGSTWNGTQGFVPESFIAGEPYSTTIQFAIPSIASNLDNCRVAILLIDNNTDAVVNAATAKLYDVNAGVSDITADAAIATVNGGEGMVTVNAGGEADVQVYDLAGRMIASAHGNGTFNVDLNNYNGIAIVRVASANAVSSHKVVVR